MKKPMQKVSFISESGINFFCKNISSFIFEFFDNDDDSFGSVLIIFSVAL